MISVIRMGHKVIPKALNINYIITITITIVAHVTDAELVIIGKKYVE